MIDTRAIGQELQDQLQAAARKGQQRVTTTARTVAATARMIRPQLPNLPRPTPATLRSALPTAEQIRSAMPTPEQIRSAREQIRAAMPTPEQIRSAMPTPEQIRSARQQIRAAMPTPEQIRSALAAPAQLIEQAPAFAAKLTGGDRFNAGTQEFIGQMRAIQHRVLDQVRDVTAPLAKRAGFPERRATYRYVVDGTATPHAENGSTEPTAAEHVPAKHAPAEHTRTEPAPAAKTPKGTARTAKTTKTAKTSRPSPASAKAKGGTRPKPTSR